MTNQKNISAADTKADQVAICNKSIMASFARYNVPPEVYTPSLVILAASALISLSTANDEEILKGFATVLKTLRVEKARIENETDKE